MDRKNNSLASEIKIMTLKKIICWNYYTLEQKTFFKVVQVSYRLLVFPFIWVGMGSMLF